MGLGFQTLGITQYQKCLEDRNRLFLAFAKLRVRPWYLSRADDFLRSCRITTKQPQLYHLRVSFFTESTTEIFFKSPGKRSSPISLGLKFTFLQPYIYNTHLFLTSLESFSKWINSRSQSTYFYKTQEVHTSFPFLYPYLWNMRIMKERIRVL